MGRRDKPGDDDAFGCSEIPPDQLPRLETTASGIQNFLVPCLFPWTRENRSLSGHTADHSG
jgi:hypothetical protein